MSRDEITLVGTIERIVYEQAETGFLIASFLVEKTREPITIKGTIFNVSEQSIVEIKGNWEHHKTYGRQFFVKEFSPVLPKSTLGIERYLTSDIPGIGKRTASRIVKEFGEDTFKIIDNSPQDLLKIPKFKKKQLEQLLEVWEEKKSERDVLTFLHEIGSSSAQALKIYKHFGLTAIPTLKANPYKLTEIHGIGFQIADQIARNLGFEENSPERATAGVLYILNQLSLNGHTCYPREALTAKTTDELKIEKDIVDAAVLQLLKDRLVKSKEISNHSQNDMTQEVIAHPRLYKAERRIAEDLSRILKSEAYTEFSSPEPLVVGIEKKLGIQLDVVQKEAVKAALEHKVMIITGGPGTGKTTIIRFILELVAKKIPHISLAAPTGRAAKRMSEANQRPASTIHRLLGASRLGFENNRENPIDSELVIIDEISMIDTLLMAALLDAIRSESRVILVGDVDQLPSVGPGAILLNLIQSEIIPVVRLEKIFRQAADSLITVNAHNVRRGSYPLIQSSDPDELQDFYFIKESDPIKVVEKIITMATDRIPKRFNFDPKTEIQVLTPMHRGVTGSINLNQQLQKRMNPATQFLQFKDQQFKVGDKVIQLQNSYEKEVFNGDVGIILDCDQKSKALLVRFDSTEVQYDIEELEQLSLAYAISVHKSQGSEYPAVILPLTTHHFVMLQRNLLYTAMTRGKQLVVIIGMENAMQLAVNNASPAKRYTLLESEFNEVWHELSLF
ncbi:MAG: ATP-dependent RecD-like DNA helicase [SAR324 cluster bacterium]|nr:ATP-dependent RecD-like DNA helicase [SAR324 cluster bacterium]